MSRFTLFISSKYTVQRKDLTSLIDNLQLMFVIIYFMNFALIWVTEQANHYATPSWYIFFTNPHFFEKGQVISARQSTLSRKRSNGELFLNLKFRVFLWRSRCVVIIIRHKRSFSMNTTVVFRLNLCLYRRISPFLYSLLANANIFLTIQFSSNFTGIFPKFLSFFHQLGLYS